jgi:hypothetical protein
VTPREKHRRVRAYARASKRAHDETVRLIRASCGLWNYVPARYPVLAMLRARESHAWARLPDVARDAIVEPT